MSAPKIAIKLKNVPNENPEMKAMMDMMTAMMAKLNQQEQIIQNLQEKLGDTPITPTLKTLKEGVMGEVPPVMVLKFIKKTKNYNRYATDGGRDFYLPCDLPDNIQVLISDVKLDKDSNGGLWGSPPIKHTYQVQHHSTTKKTEMYKSVGVIHYLETEDLKRDYGKVPDSLYYHIIY